MGKKKDFIYDPNNFVIDEVFKVINKQKKKEGKKEKSTKGSDNGALVINIWQREGSFRNE